MCKKYIQILIVSTGLDEAYDLSRAIKCQMIDRARYTNLITANKCPSLRRA